MSSAKNYMQVERKELNVAIDELESAVSQMEKATDEILSRAEKLLDGLSGDKPDIATLQGQATDLFELCSFQDITSQRIGKAKVLLERIAGRAEHKKTDARKAQEKSGLLSGPSKDGEGISQGDVDKLFK